MAIWGYSWYIPLSPQPVTIPFCKRLLCQESFTHFVIYTRSWLAEQTTPVAFAFEDKVAERGGWFRVHIFFLGLKSALLPMRGFEMVWCLLERRSVWRVEGYLEGHVGMFSSPSAILKGNLFVDGRLMLTVGDLIVPFSTWQLWIVIIVYWINGLLTTVTTVVLVTVTSSYHSYYMLL